MRAIVIAILPFGPLLRSANLVAMVADACQLAKVFAVANDDILHAFEKSSLRT